VIPKCTYQPKVKHSEFTGTFQCDRIPQMIMRKDLPSIEHRRKPTSKQKKGDLIVVAYQHEWADLCTYHQYLTDYPPKVGKES